MTEMSVLKVVEHGRLAILPMFRQLSLSNLIHFKSNFTNEVIVFFTTLICGQRLRWYIVWSWSWSSFCYHDAHTYTSRSTKHERDRFINLYSKWRRDVMEISFQAWLELVEIHQTRLQQMTSDLTPPPVCYIPCAYIVASHSFIQWA